MKKKFFVVIPLLLALVIGLSATFAAEGERPAYTASRDTYFVASEPYGAPILTCEAWVNIPNRIVGDFSRMNILSNYKGYNDSLSFAVARNGQPCIVYRGEGTSRSYIFKDGDVREGIWMHLAFTIDAEAKMAYCYIDSELIGSLEIDFDPMKIYQYPYMLANDGETAKPNAFRGQLASVTAYSDMRTADEIAADMNSESPDTDHLIAHYDLSGDTSEGVKDSSGVYDMKFVDQWIAENTHVGDYSYTFVAVGDTQKLAVDHPEEFKKIYNWLYDNIEKEKIKLVMSMGDVTNDDTDEEWTLAAEYIRLLDGMVPYTVLRGNHDSHEQLDTYFPYEEYADRLGGSHSGDSIINSWQEVVVNDIKYLIMCLDCDPSDEAIAWANEVVAAHPEHNVIVTTHSYLYYDGDFNNQGERLWKEFTSKHANIVLVLCGHEHSDPIMVKESVGVNGNTVTQMLIDAQTVDQDNTPVGMVALFHFSEDGRQVAVEYLSTVKEMYFTPESQFTFELPVVGAPDASANILENPVTYVILGVIVIAAAVIVVVVLKKKK